MSIPAGAAPPSAAPSAWGSTVADRLLGVAGGAMILLAVVLFFIGGESDGAQTEVVEAPAVELVQPQHGATLRTERLLLVFRVEGEFGPRPGGWGNESMHLHLALDDAELMPGPPDIERLPSGLFRWTLPRPAPGLHTVRLFWSGPDHRPIPGTGSRVAQIRVEE